MTTAFTILPPARGGESCSLFAVHQGEIEAWLQSQPAAVAAWCVRTDSRVNDTGC